MHNKQFHILSFIIAIFVSFSLISCTDWSIEPEPTFEGDWSGTATISGIGQSCEFSFRVLLSPYAAGAFGHSIWIKWSDTYSNYMWYDPNDEFLSGEYAIRNDWDIGCYGGAYVLSNGDIQDDGSEAYLFGLMVTTGYDETRTDEERNWVLGNLEDLHASISGHLNKNTKSGFGRIVVTVPSGPTTTSAEWSPAIYIDFDVTKDEGSNR